MRFLLAFFIFLIPTLALSHPFQFPFREVRGHICYDGDTCYISVPYFPVVELQNMSVRIKGIDSPEIRGTCQSEKDLAVKARDRLIEIITSSMFVEFTDIEWDKYGGRIAATVLVDGDNVGQFLINEGLARQYDGTTSRQSWCN